MLGRHDCESKNLPVQLAAIGKPMFGTQVLHPGGEALVQPEVRPPIAGDDVSEPHVGQFVRNHLHGVFQVRVRGDTFLIQHRSFPITGKNFQN